MKTTLKATRALETNLKATHAKQTNLEATDAMNANLWRTRGHSAAIISMKIANWFVTCQLTMFSWNNRLNSLSLHGMAVNYNS